MYEPQHQLTAYWLQDNDIGVTEADMASTLNPLGTKDFHQALIGVTKGKTEAFED